MQQQNISDTKPTLEEVSNQPENWRKNKRNHREPIPKIYGRQQLSLPENIQ